MIISDTEGFVFMHNPKAGGMTFRTALANHDTRDNFFFEWKIVGDSEKQLDMAHITPFQLRRFFPQVFEDVREYYKFGFVRNPYARFLSAISQHLKMCTPYVRNAILSHPDLFYDFASSFAVNVLRPEPIESDHRLVHFRRQSNFFFLDQEQWVPNIFELERPDKIRGTPVEAWLGEALIAPKNQTKEFADGGYDLSRITPQAISKITEFYSIDFERFGYETI